MMFQGSKIFMMKATLMWIINEFAACFVVCSGHGRFAFVHCIRTPSHYMMAGKVDGLTY